jgi:hypothetical protein
MTTAMLIQMLDDMEGDVDEGDLVRDFTNYLSSGLGNIPDQTACIW